MLKEPNVLCNAQNLKKNMLFRKSIHLYPNFTNIIMLIVQHLFCDSCLHIKCITSNIGWLNKVQWISPTPYHWFKEKFHPNMITSWNRNVFRIIGLLRGPRQSSMVSPIKGPVLRSFDISFMLYWTSCRRNCRVAGGLTRHDDHVMSLWWQAVS